MVDVSFCDVCIEVLTFDKPQEKLVNDLNMGPSDFQNWLVLLRVECLTLGCDWGWNRSKQILCEHFNHARIHGLCDDRTVVGNIIQELVECQSLDLLGLHVRRRVIEIEYNVALIDLLHEEFLAAVRGHFVKAGKLFQLSLALVGDIKSGRMLALWSPDTLRHILRGRLKAIEDMGLPGRGQVSWHCLSGAGRRGML